MSGRVETKDLRGKLVSPGAGVWMVDLVGDVEESFPCRPRELWRLRRSKRRGAAV